MLKLFYITNNPSVAKIAENAGVDRIFVDLEYIGKEERQHNMDTVKNHHTPQDVKNIKSALTKADLLVRVNPINEGSKAEIDAVIEAGADIVMLPMWKTVDEVKKFVAYVDNRVKTMLLLETDEASKIVDDVLDECTVDEIHIGLNDLHLSQHKNFLFELLTDGTVDNIVEKLKNHNIPYGFGGFGRVKSKALLPAENIIAEHYRLGSSMAILSRAFCNTNIITDIDEIEKIFNNGVRDNREYEKSLLSKDTDFFNSKHIETAQIIDKIVRDKII